MELLSQMLFPLFRLSSKAIIAVCPHLYNNILIALQPQKLFICTFVMSTRISVTCTEDKKVDRYRCKKK
ncbi:Uncharacterized protein APZ42_003649 [Daphnia magna]|uniref:Uncharacterized protein n=1 Tax=Daphnia magna TaxID=35525 RepID=A0A0P5ZQE7_9CRUS|nr:Uncharacterized protein APZ42_003649 [Daphnia magna]